MTQTQQELQSQQLDFYKFKLCESMQLIVNISMKTFSSNSIFNTQQKCELTIFLVQSLFNSYCVLVPNRV
jgi:hypothetical protein